jgi:hypothetical protein
MDAKNLIGLLVSELGFTVDEAQFNRHDYTIRRPIPADNPRRAMGWKSEYTTVSVKGEVVVVTIADMNSNSARIPITYRHILLADPDCFEQLRKILDIPGALQGSMVSTSTADYVFTE